MGKCNSVVVHFSSRSPFLFQDAIDLFLGNYSVDEVEPASPLHVQKDWKFLAVSMQTLFMTGETPITFQSLASCD